MSGFSLTPKQREANRLLAGDAKHILIEGGSRSGKTALLCRAIIARAIKAPRSRHVIVRFHFKDAKDSIGMDTLPKIFEQAFPQCPYTLNKSDWIFTLPVNRSEIWLGGLDDKERTEKVLGKEYATIYLNEASQISWQARNLAVTRLAQVVQYADDEGPRELKRKMYYDLNPPSKSHWAYQVFHLGRDPESKQLLAEPNDYARIRINPIDNPHLPADYIRELQGQSARMRRRFFAGEYAEVAPGALWTDEMIDRWRNSQDDLPEFLRIVIGVDPSGASEDENENNDEIGIVVAGLGADGNGYVLEDLTLKAGPKTWGGVAVNAYDRHDADAIVCEKNFGGEMVRYVIASQPRAGARARTCKLVTASRGKAVRAEPISALHEQGKIRFAGRFQELEDELCSMTTHGYVGERSPNRADAFVWAMSELFPAIVKPERAKPKQAQREYTHAMSQGWMGA